jgi:hypothetical protein
VCMYVLTVNINSLLILYPFVCGVVVVVVATLLAFPTEVDISHRNKQVVLIITQ